MRLLIARHLILILQPLIDVTDIKLWVLFALQFKYCTLMADLIYLVV
jgi:hypothetical protein